MLIIDTTFDFRVDSNGKDPDKYSKTLRTYHKLIWDKKLPVGSEFTLNDDKAGAYLYHKSSIGEFYLSSDSIIPTFSKWKRLEGIIHQFSKAEIEEFRYLSYTIGGMIIFPGNKIDGKLTINGERGLNAKIADRFDLTLECIRRYYNNDQSPLYITLTRYKDFFNLFIDFRGYVDYFLLHDLVSRDYQAIKFFMPFNDFSNSPLPQGFEDYKYYKDSTVNFIKLRNNRINMLNNL